MMLKNFLNLGIFMGLLSSLPLWAQGTVSGQKQCVVQIKNLSSVVKGDMVTIEGKEGALTAKITTVSLSPKYVVAKINQASCPDLKGASVSVGGGASQEGAGESLGGIEATNHSPLQFFAGLQLGGHMASLSTTTESTESTELGSFLMEGSLQGGLNYFFTPEIYIPAILGFSYMMGTVTQKGDVQEGQPSFEYNFNSLGIEFFTGAGYKMGAFKGALIGGLRFGLSNTFESNIVTEGAENTEEPSISYMLYGGGVRLEYRVWENLDINFEGLYMLGSLAKKVGETETSLDASNLVGRLGGSWTF